MHIRILFLSLFVSLSLSACGSTLAANPEATRSAAAPTLSAQLAPAQTEAAQQTFVAETATAQALASAEQATQERLQLFGSETAAAQATRAAVEPQLFSRETASCRKGPNNAFVSLALLIPFEVVDVFGRSSNGDWWQVASPLNDGQTCWVFWRNDLELLGDVHNLPFIEGPSLPIQTLAPTKPPGFSLRYVNDLVCKGSKYAVVVVRNTGPEIYQSAIVTLFDVDAAVQLARSDGNHEFLATRTSCPKGNPTLAPGQEAFLAISTQGASSGSSLRITVRLCTEKGYKGNCISSSTTFTK